VAVVTVIMVVVVVTLPLVETVLMRVVVLVMIVVSGVSVAVSTDDPVSSTFSSSSSFSWSSSYWESSSSCLVAERSEKFKIERPEAHGGNVEFEDFDSLEAAFGKEEIHPGDLKSAVETYLNRLMDPVRKIFESPELKKLTERAYPPPAKEKKGGNKAAPAEAELGPSRLDMRVGKIVEVGRHPDAEKLYVEKIDLGEAVPRTIVSGLVDFVPQEQMEGRMVVVLANLKPAKMRGVESCGMVLCSSREEPKEVEPLGVPEGAAVGDRVTVEGHDDGEPDEVLNPKKKVWEKLAVDLATDGNGLAQWQGNALEIKGKGQVTVKTVKGAPIK